MQMKLIKIFFVMLIIGILGLAFRSLNSSADISCTAHVLGGHGTVQDPLRIMIKGNSGFVGLIVDMLPFNSIPPVISEFSQYAFYVPMFNKFFLGKPLLAEILYVIFILVSPFVILWAFLKMAGFRIHIVRDYRRNRNA